MKASVILGKIAAFFTLYPERWCQAAYKQKIGAYFSYCVAGRLRVFPSSDEREYAFTSLRSVSPGDFLAYNDNPSTTVQNIIALCRSAQAWAYTRGH